MEILEYFGRGIGNSELWKKLCSFNSSPSSVFGLSNIKGGNFTSITFSGKESFRFLPQKFSNRLPAISETKTMTVTFLQ